MGILKYILLPIGFAVLIPFIHDNWPAAKIEIDENGYFGSGKSHPDDTKIKPFKIAVEDGVIQDLKERLKNSRVSHSVLEDSDNFYYGFNSKHLMKLRDYWLTKYDWKKYESLINSFPQFTTEIEGLQIHFIHSKPPSGYKTIKPLLVSHGWPGNIFELYKFIPILTDPRKHGIESEFAFEVIAPSIPGYGWSEQPKKTGFSQLACARVFRKLMLRLGFNKFYLQGGDWGALITSYMTRIYPESIIALHLNTMFIVPGGSLVGTIVEYASKYMPFLLSSEHLKTAHDPSRKFLNILAESGYMHLQATKPDTAGTSLNDSPLGLAAYILEKYSTWTNIEHRSLPDGGLTKRFTNDELLTIVMIYWVNGNIASSQRFYREFFTDWRMVEIGKQYISTPTAHASGLNELFDLTPIEVSRHLYNVTYYKEIDSGHFAAFEKPKELAETVFEFIKGL